MRSVAVVLPEMMEPCGVGPSVMGVPFFRQRYVGGCNVLVTVKDRDTEPFVQAAVSSGCR